MYKLITCLLFTCLIAVIPLLANSNNKENIVDTTTFTKKIDSLCHLADYYLDKEQYEKSLQFSFQGIDLYNQNGLIIPQIHLYQRIISIFVFMRNFELADKYLQTISKIAANTSDDNAHAWVNLCYGRYYHELKDYPAATKKLYMALFCLEKKTNPHLEINICKALGDAYLQLDDFSFAIYWYNKAIAICTDESNLIEIAVLYTRIAHIHQVRQNNLQNLLFNLKAMKIREKTGSMALLSSSYLNVGESYWLLGQNDSAQVYMKKSLQLALKMNQAFYLEVVYRSLRDFAISEGRDKDALNYYEKCAANRIKLNQEKNKSEILILEANQSLNESEDQNEKIIKENLIQDLNIRSRKINTAFFEMAFLSILTLIFIMEAMVRNIKKRQLKLQALNNQFILEIKSHREASCKLHQSEVLHRFLAENTSDVISLLKPDLTPSYVSNSCEKLYGLTADQILTITSPLDLVDSCDKPYVNGRLLDILQSKKPTRFIFQAIRGDKLSFWAEANINPIIENANGNIKSIISVVRDYSERKQYEDELTQNAKQKEYLFKEIHNRVKNNFSILGSLMTMIKDKSPDNKLQQSLTDLLLRIRTMSLVHEQLYHSKEINTIPFDNYLDNLCRIIANSFDNHRINLETEIQKCDLTIDLTLPIGLIVNELLTNAYKYAFPDTRQGIIKVVLVQLKPDSYCISVCDNGIGLPKSFSMDNSSSMGSWMIGILVQQIEGELLVSNNNGACFNLNFHKSS